jgi:putative DNA primase/helicase
MIWDGKCWDETLAGFNLARTVCRMAASKCNKGKSATMLASAKTVAAVERLARADRKLAATVN